MFYLLFILIALAAVCCYTSDSLTLVALLIVGLCFATSLSTPSKVSTKGGFSINATYLPGDIVVYRDSTYLCTQQTSSALPTDSEYWQVISKGRELTNSLTYQGVWSSSASYSVNDVVTYQDYVYVALNNSINSSVSSADWKALVTPRWINNNGVLQLSFPQGSEADIFNVSFYNSLQGTSLRVNNSGDTGSRARMDFVTNNGKQDILAIVGSSTGSSIRSEYLSSANGVPGNKSISVQFAQENNAVYTGAVFSHLEAPSNNGVSLTPIYHLPIGFTTTPVYGTGGNKVGNYTYKMSYVDADGYFTDFGAPLTVSLSNAAGVNILLPRTDNTPSPSAIRVHRTKVNGSVFYLAATVPYSNTSYNEVADDTSLTVASTDVYNKTSNTSIMRKLKLKNYPAATGTTIMSSADGGTLTAPGGITDTFAVLGVSQTFTAPVLTFQNTNTSGTATFQSDVLAQTTLTVVGTFGAVNSSSFGGPVAMGNVLAVSGAATFQGPVNVTTTLSANTILSVTGSFTNMLISNLSAANSTLYAASINNATIATETVNNATINNLTANNTATFNQISAVGVTSNTLSATFVNISGTGTLGNLRVNNTAAASNFIAVNGFSGQTLNIAGTATVNYLNVMQSATCSALTVAGVGTLAALNVTSTSTFNAVNVQGTSTVNNLVATGTMTANSTLTANATVNINSTFNVNGITFTYMNDTAYGLQEAKVGNMVFVDIPSGFSFAVASPTSGLGASALNPPYYPQVGKVFNGWASYDSTPTTYFQIRIGFGSGGGISVVRTDGGNFTSNFTLASTSFHWRSQ